MKSLADLALSRLSPGALGCGRVGGNEGSAPLAQSMPEAPGQGKPVAAGSLSRWSAWEGLFCMIAVCGRRLVNARDADG